MSASVPIAALLRSRKRDRAIRTKTNKKNEDQKDSGTSLQEQIEALEKQIDEESDSSSGSESWKSSDDCASDGNGWKAEESLRKVNSASNVFIEEDGTGNVVKFVSSLSKERIAPLQKKYLPAADCGASNKKKDFTADSKVNERKRAIRFEDVREKESKKRGKKDDSSNSSLIKNRKKEDGMEKTIREMLTDYTPASAERKPFWCRICRFQGKDEGDLFEHRKSEFHRTAANIEMKMSYCHLCRKQFTSPMQLKEHLAAKAHKERLERVRDANVRREKFK